MSRDFCEFCGPDNGCLNCQELEDELEMWKTLCIKLSKAVTNKGISPEFHDSIMKKHRKEWPYIWNQIDPIIKAVEKRNGY